MDRTRIPAKSSAELGILDQERGVPLPKDEEMTQDELHAYMVAELDKWREANQTSVQEALEEGHTDKDSPAKTGHAKAKDTKFDKMKPFNLTSQRIRNMSPSELVKLCRERGIIVPDGLQKQVKKDMRQFKQPLLSDAQDKSRQFLFPHGLPDEFLWRNLQVICCCLLLFG